MTFQKALQYLHSFTNYESKLSSLRPSDLNLARVSDLLEKIGKPHKKIKCVHIAGSNAKGSVCAFLSFILSSAGYRVGLYTSPHLNILNERIRIFTPQGKFKNISNQDLTKVIEKLKSKIEEARKDKRSGDLTFFEVLTAAALYYFALEKVDVVVLETGLGGRLDATNAVDSLVCGITPISFEHTKILGSTLTAIVNEKAAIIKKPMQLVILAPQPLEAMRVLKKRCAEYGITPTVIGKDIRIEKASSNLKEQRFILKTPQGVYRNLKIHLLGKHQIENAAFAVGLAEALQAHGFVMQKKAIVQGLSRTAWPGRFEMFSFKPLVILDGAHNPQAFEVLVQAVKTFLPKKNILLILGLSNDKDIKGICRWAKDLSSKIIATQADHPRALASKELADQPLIKSRIFARTDNVKEAVRIAMKQKSDAILIAGSLFVVGEARRRLHVSI